MNAREGQLKEQRDLLAVKGRSYFMTPAEQQKWRGLNAVVSVNKDDVLVRLHGRAHGRLYGYEVGRPTWGSLVMFCDHDVKEVLPWN